MMRILVRPQILAPMSVRLRIVLGVICVLAIAAAAPFAFSYVTKYLRVGLDPGDNPLDYVTVVHRQLPPGQMPAPWVERLEESAGADLGIVVRHDWGTRGGDGPYAADAGFRAKLAEHVTDPQAPDYRVLGVATNTVDPEAVKEFGSFYAIWFQTPVDAETWMMADPEVFADAAAEEARQTWWAGFYAVYYAPPAEGTDLTDEVDGWVRSITACPNSGEGCVVPEHLRTAGATPSS